MTEEEEKSEELGSYPCGDPACMKPASKKCSRCRAVYYCSKACMAATWKSHKLACKRLATGGFRVQEMPGKGLGMVATRVFLPGDIILIEEPLVVFRDGEPVYQILQRFEALAEEEKKVLLALYDPGEDPTRDVPGVTDETHRKFVRITWANGHQLCSYPEFGVDGSGVYPTVCRINHACAPNALWTWIAGDRTKRTKQVRACHRIEEGEEVSFSYIQLGNCFPGLEERRRRLRNWFPGCGCGVCRRTGEELEESERVREQLARLHQEVRLLCKEGRLSEAAQAVLHKIQIMEGLEKEMVQQLPWALLDYCELSVMLRSRGEEEEGDRLREEQFRERAEKTATHFGDSSVFKYEKKCLRMSKLAPDYRQAVTKLLSKEPDHTQAMKSTEQRTTESRSEIF